MEGKDLEKKRKSTVSGVSGMSRKKKRKSKALPKMIDEDLREEDDETVTDAKQLDSTPSPVKNQDLQEVVNEVRGESLTPEVVSKKKTPPVSSQRQ